MAEFKEELVINALHPEKAEEGKKYYYSDRLLNLRKYVEENNITYTGELTSTEDKSYPFCVDEGSCGWQFLYPYEEPPKKSWLEESMETQGGRPFLPSCSDYKKKKICFKNGATEVCKKILEEVKSRYYADKDTVGILEDIIKDLGVEL